MSNTKSFSQSVRINGPLAKVYNAFVDSDVYSSFIRAPAKSSERPGSSFSAYDGYLEGFVLSAEKEKRLVLAFRTKEWRSGDFSIVRLDFSAAGSGQTNISLYHYGIPDDHTASNSTVWGQFYWDKLNTYLDTESP